MVYAIRDMVDNKYISTVFKDLYSTGYSYEDDFGLAIEFDSQFAAEMFLHRNKIKYPVEIVKVYRGV